MGMGEFDMLLVRIAFAVLASACLAGAWVAPAAAKVRITVDLDNQTMHVEAKDQTFDWQVSSGKEGYETPPGSYKVLWMDRTHRSEEYDGAPMPNAIFFAPGFAIHGFGRSPWGHPASHGCVRLPVAKSAILFDLVKQEGAEIEITGGGATDGGAIAMRRGGPAPGEPGYPTLTARGPLDSVMAE